MIQFILIVVQAEKHIRVGQRHSRELIYDMSILYRIGLEKISSRWDIVEQILDTDACPYLTLTRFLRQNLRAFDDDLST